VCYDGACKELKQVRFVDLEGTDPAPVPYYGVGPQKCEETCDESSDVAEEVHKPLLVEEKFFLTCNEQNQTWKQGKKIKENKVENCAWTPVVDENMLKFVESIEHKSGWSPFENGHAQVAYRAKALRPKEVPFKDFHCEEKKECAGSFRSIMT
jgi:hypothetical protein